MSTTIRLRTSGLMVFGGRLASAFTGLLFTVMVARWLSVPQVGLWEVIVDLVTFSAYPVGIVAFWVTRDVARGKMVGRTAFALGGLLSAGGLLIYFFFMVVTYSSLAASVVPFFLGALLVPLSYWSAVANSIVQGHRPGFYGVSLISSELAKLFVAYTSLYVFRLGINGVILALIASYFVQSVASTYAVRITASEKYDYAQSRRWARMAWLPAISSLPTVVAISDTFVASVAFGTGITGLYQVAYVVASVVGYSSALGFSLYPLLLREGGERLPALTIEFSMLFSIPMAVGCVVLAGPILFIFGGSYLVGSTALAILAVTAMFATLSGIVDQTLLGTERVDVGERVGFWALAHSNLMFVPLANLLQALAYIASMFVALYVSFSRGYAPSTSLELWAAVQLAAALAFLGYKGNRARRYAKLLPGREILYYIGGALLMGLVVYVLSGILVDQSLDSLYYGIRMVIIVGTGSLVYFGSVYAVDPKFRRMARSFFR